ncbi:hypothetical protein DM01DRAFT_205439 [Hesseltinella vesiculosa]|uniref:Uncharacterized protein n=1 Tax=Hesseltinella vesiculosa TaxID=101127 RepID=A0A1X2GJI4_9FUNG|nr:hypothetical protein DM01DRAFT_205439 [Hesseltinella vesiculosa]
MSFCGKKKWRLVDVYRLPETEPYSVSAQFFSASCVRGMIKAVTVFLHQIGTLGIGLLWRRLEFRIVLELSCLRQPGVEGTVQRLITANQFFLHF